MLRILEKITKMFGKIRKRIKSFVNVLMECYISIVLNWPLIVFCSYFVLTGIASFHSIYFHFSDVSFDSTKGFETRGTPRSEARLALEHLFNAAASKTDLIIGRRAKRSPEEDSSSTLSPLENFTINYDDYGVDDPDEVEEITPCKMYLGWEKQPKSDLLFDSLSKAIFEVESFEKLFELSTLKNLCKLDDIIDRVINETKIRDFKIDFVPFSFNLPNYVTCANGSYIKKCENLDQKTVDAFKEVVLSCVNPETEEEILNCETNFAIQLRDYIFQKPKIPHQLPQGPIYVGAVLKLYSPAAVPASSTNKFYTTLLRHLSRDFGDTIKLKGLFVGYKNAFFEEALYSDIILGCGALAMVILGILLYSKSLAFTGIVLIGMAFAVGTSFFIYAALFRISFFPFINFLVVVIAIAVGADDAFLLSYQFDKHKSELNILNAKLLNFDPDLICDKEKHGYSYSINEKVDYKNLFLQSRSQVIKAAVSEALRHAAIAMFVTSITTAVAFLTNCYSSILILRCFGIFAATTILANYFFVVSALPAALVLLNSQSCFELESMPNILQKMQTCLSWISNFYIYRMPLLVYKTFYAILFVTFLVFAGSIYVIAINPGIRLPEHNAMQLLRSDHPFEWFDEHHAQYFNFRSHQAYMQYFYAVWGIEPTTDSSWLNADDRGTLQPSSPTIKLSKANLEILDSQMSIIKNATFLNPSRTHKFNTTFARRFIEWGEKCEVEGCCWETASTILPESCLLNYSKDHTNYFKPTESQFMPFIQESAIFEKETHKFMGFLIQGQSKFPFTNTFHALKQYFGELDSTRNSMSQSSHSPPILISRPITTNLFDLLNSLLYGTTISIGISLAICALVIIFSTTRPMLSLAAIISIAFSISLITSILLLLGWTINVVEATILVITIGLCFDYTLHLAVAYKLSSDIVVTEKVREANEACAIPIALASLTNIAAGLILFFSQTQAFFEIGIFLVVMTFVSFFSAHFVFVSFIYLFSKFSCNDKI